MSDSYYVYALLDPREQLYRNGDLEFPHVPFYVGKGKNNRCREHLQEWSLKSRTNPRKNATIKAIIANGLDPVVVKLREGLSGEEASQLETETISLIGRLDSGTGPLTNLTDGGEGTPGHVVSAESRALMSRQRKGKRQTEAQYCANCSRQMTPEHKEKISAALRGKKQDAEFVKRRTARLTGSKRSEETKALMSSQRAGRKQTPAQYAANRARINNHPIVSYEELKSFIRSVGVTTARGWTQYVKENDLSPEYPRNPRNSYLNRGTWVSWEDLLRG